MAKIFLRQNGKQAFEYADYFYDKELEGIATIHLEIDTISYNEPIELLYVNGQKVRDEELISNYFKKYFYPTISKVRQKIQAQERSNEYYYSKINATTTSRRRR
jgi:hypothetical protein